MAKLFAWTRQFTGTPWVHRAYVRDRETGTVVWACPHRHTTKRGGVSGAVLAEKCAQKQLARMLRAEGGR